MNIREMIREEHRRRARVKAAVVAYSEQRAAIHRFQAQPSPVPPTPPSHGENPVVILIVKGD